MADKILIIEDETRIVRTLRLYLEQAGFAVITLANGSQVIPTVRQEHPCLILLDLNLPGQDGLEVCRILRREGDTPIIMVTARVEESDRLIGLELGADDYIVKPFSPREVVARVRAVLRRARGPSSRNCNLRVGDLTLDVPGRRAWLGNQVLTLTQSEYNILLALMQHPGHVLSRAQLLETTQGCNIEEFERSIDQHIKNLRRKLREIVGPIPVIQTVYGVGYRLQEIRVVDA
jgi:two-component system, OmpR family, alkaline phosphatase synthesis response regulator PhoP